MSDIYKKYYEVKRQIDVLQEQEKELKEQVLEEAMKVKDNTIKTEFGTFTKRTSRRWAYSMDFLDKSIEVEKKIKAYSQPLMEQIETFSAPLKNEIEELKKKEVYEGKAKEIVDVNIAFSYNK